MSTFTLEGAYIYLNINNGSSLADEDVGVALYKTWNLNRELHGRERNALECIVEARKSRFLRFLAIIGEQLNEKNVAVLAKKTWFVSPEPENVGEGRVGAHSTGEKPASGKAWRVVNHLRIMLANHPGARWRWMLTESTTRPAKTVHPSPEAPLHQKHPSLPVTG